MSTATKTTRHASREEWAALRAKASPGNLRDLDSGVMPVYEDAAGTKRLLPPKGLTTYDVAPSGVIARSVPVVTRPEPRSSKRSAAEEVLDEVRALSGVYVEDGVIREIERMTSTAMPEHSTKMATTATRSTIGDDAIDEIKRLGAIDEHVSALDEVAALGKAG